MKLRFTIRDLCWLTLTIALVMWAIVERHRAYHQWEEALQAKLRANQVMGANGHFAPESFYNLHAARQDKP